MCWRESLLLVPSEIGREILEKFHQVRIRCCTKSKNSTSAAPCASNLGENFTYRLSLCNPFIPFTGCIVVSLWSLLVTGCCWQDLHDLETAVCFLSHFMRLHLIVHKSLLQTCPDWFEESVGDICPAGTIPGYRSCCRTPEQLCGSVTSPPVRAELKGSWHDEQSLAWEREFWWQSWGFGKCSRRGSSSLHFCKMGGGQGNHSVTVPERWEQPGPAAAAGVLQVLGARSTTLELGSL